MRLFMFRVFCLIALVFGLNHCSNDSVADGGGSDTETISGLVILKSGMVASNAVVKLIPKDYNPSHFEPSVIRKTITDSLGRFQFNQLKTTDSFNLIATVPNQNHWAFEANQVAGVHGLNLSLKIPAVFLISLEYPTYARKDSGLAYFPGTDILTRCNGVSPSNIDSIPIGLNHIVVESRAGWRHDTTLMYAQDTLRLRADSNGLYWNP